MKPELSQKLIHEFFDYNNGYLYWKKPVSKCSRIKIGSKAGSVAIDRRRVIRFNNCLYLSSRLIFLWHHGFMPEFVDHIDRNGVNDKIENLRAATRLQNNQNSTSRKYSTSKYLGVHIYIDKRQRKNGVNNAKTRCIASIGINCIKTYIGMFKTEVEAALAYNSEAVKNHKEFANLNIIKV
jgi:hypothetical protein